MKCCIYRSTNFIIIKSISSNVEGAIPHAIVYLFTIHDNAKVVIKK